MNFSVFILRTLTNTDSSALLTAYFGLNSFKGHVKSKRGRCSLPFGCFYTSQHLRKLLLFVPCSKSSCNTDTSRKHHSPSSCNFPSCLHHCGDNVYTPTAHPQIRSVQTHQPPPVGVIKAQPFYLLH